MECYKIEIVKDKLYFVLLKLTGIIKIRRDIEFRLLPLVGPRVGEDAMRHWPLGHSATGFAQQGGGSEEKRADERMAAPR